MLTRVLSDSIRSIGILVVALRMVLRDADVLVHVESLHIFEAHFARLVCLVGENNQIKVCHLLFHWRGNYS